MILGQPKKLDDVEPLSVAEGTAMCNALHGLLTQGIPPEFSVLFPFWCALKIGRTIQAYGQALERIRAASEVDEVLRPAALRAAAEEAGRLLSQPNGKFEITLAVMPPLNMQTPGPTGMTSPGRLVV